MMFGVPFSLPVNELAVFYQLLAAGIIIMFVMLIESATR